MNVTTSPRKSTDTAEPQQQSQPQQHSHQQPVIAYESCRQAASNAVVTTRINSSRSTIEEQDQLVSSTSNECPLMPTEGEGEEINLELDPLIRSPTRISSSTVGYEVQTNANSSVTDKVMPTTSEHSINILATHSMTEPDATHKLLQNSTNTSSTSSKVSNYNEIIMRNVKSTSITRDCETNTKECDMQRASNFNKGTGESGTEHHKIILKLSKTSSAGIGVESCLKSADRKISDNEDLRKVEPLKINLLGTHTHSPKITIKPIIKTFPQGDVTGSSEECSSSAEDEMDLRRNMNAHEPHVLPKLTIRAVNEERGSSVTSIVPKLTIKINDSMAGSSASTTHNLEKEPSMCGDNIIGNVHLMANSIAQQTNVILPLPKLTIKTGSDGQSESIMMNVSPTSSTSSSSISHCFSSSSLSSFSSNSSVNCLISTSCGLSAASTMTQTVPKLTIKPLPMTPEKDSDTTSLITLPKYIVKNPNLCTAEKANCGEILDQSQITSKLPKLTIKTGQERAVIITQHNDNAGSPGIPKLTIKTKSFEGGAEPLSSIVDETADSNEKIPKITIKTAIPNTNNTTSVIPKLTINVSQLESVGGNGVVGSSSSHHTSSLKQTIPKLTITRQQTDKLLTNHHQVTSNLDITAKEESETIMPKMAIRTQKKLLSVVQPSTPTYFETPDYVRMQKQEGEGDKEVLNKERQTNIKSPKVVPKLTIKNLGSPKLKMMVVRDVIGNEQAREENHSKKTLNATYAPHEILTTRELEDFSNVMLVANGAESNSSQEFCGFNDIQPNHAILANSDSPLVVQQIRRNSDDMDIDEALQEQHDPQIFNNLEQFTEPSLSSANGSSCLIPSAPDIASVMTTQIIDTVDLTSSPSPRNSPYNLNYNEEMSHATDRILNQIPQSQINTSVTQPTTNILLECLQREPAVSTYPYKSIVYDIHTQKQPQMVSSPIQPMPLNSCPASFKYPQLAEQLFASGIINNNILKPTEQPNFSNSCGNNNNTFISRGTTVEGSSKTKIKTNEEIIDSIEIFDSPESSPNHSSANAQLKEFKYKLGEKPHHLQYLPNGLRYNHNIISKHSSNLEIVQHNNSNSNKNIAVLTKGNLKRTTAMDTVNNLTEVSQLGMSPPKMHCVGNDDKDMATLACLARIDNEASTALIPSTIQIHKNIISHMDTTKAIQSNPVVNHLKSDGQFIQEDIKILKSVAGNSSTHQRSRKQRHEHLLPVPMDEIEPIQLHSSKGAIDLNTDSLNGDHNMITQFKRRGRPKKFNTVDSRRAETRSNVEQSSLLQRTISVAEQASKSRRVQLLRKRLAIDMVAAEQPITIINEQIEKALITGNSDESNNTGEGEYEKHRAEERALRAPVRSSRRSNTPTQKCSFNIAIGSATTLSNIIDQIPKNITVSEVQQSIHQKISDPSTALNNICRSTDTNLSSITCTHSLANTTTTITSIESTNSLDTTTTSSMCMSAQIDLTMSSSSSSASNYSTTATTTTAEVSASLHIQNNTNTNSGEAAGSNMTGANGSILSSNSNNSMLPPTTILSSSNPLPDVVFKPNDFSSIIVTQQLRSPLYSSPRNEISKDAKINVEAHIKDLNDIKTSNSRENSKYLSTPIRGRSRGRGRGSNRGGRGSRGHRLSHGVSCNVMNPTVMNRGEWSCSKNNQDSLRPSPQVFEEDTRMSADLSQNQPSLITHDSPATRQQAEFLANEESQSSVVSNNSTIDPNAGPSNTTSNTSSSTLAKKPKKKKMEVCVAEDTEISVAALAKYDWPPPKGCCPSKHRENFMIQEQVALYLGIKSFKRKYPDLARRQIDIEERNWLQEKGLVSEKMCDLGITAVLASDILDIMVTDFYDKYEEYMDYERQKHFREKDAKNRTLGLHGPTKGLQAKDRAMLSASKWNSYLNKTRREERSNCLDLQTFIVNKPVLQHAPVATLINRSIVETVATAIKTIQFYQPPSPILPTAQVRSTQVIKSRDSYYPLTLVPGQFCEKYITYTVQELKQLPVKTVLDHTAKWWPKSLSERNESTDTDSAAETAVDATTSQDGNESYMERIRRRRSRRTRAKFRHKLFQLNRKNSNNNKNLKLSELREDKIKYTTSNSTESRSITDNSVTDSDDSAVSSTLSSLTATITESSDNNESNTMSTNNCDVCQQPQNCNLKNMPEFFIQCFTCRQKVHPSCIEMPHRMSLRVRNYNWQCADCKCCIKCKRHRDQNKMLFCEQCDRGYHIYCLNIKAVPDYRWSCERCSICMRCGSTNPEGLTIVQHKIEHISSSNEKQMKQIKHKKVKWINEYRIDHITKLREHYSMLCVPCGRMKSVKRVQTMSNTTNCSASNSTVNTTSLNNNNAISNAYNTDYNCNNNIDSDGNSNINPALHNTTTAFHNTTVKTIPFHLANTTVNYENATANVNINSNSNTITVTSKPISTSVSPNEMDLDPFCAIKQSANTSTTVKSSISTTTNMTATVAIITNSTSSTVTPKQDDNCAAPAVVA